MAKELEEMSREELLARKAELEAGASAETSDLDNMSREQLLARREELMAQEEGTSLTLEEQDEVSTTEAVLRAGAQGLTMNFAEEIEAAYKTVTGDKSYEDNIKESRKAFKRAEEAHPAAYTVAEIAGGVAGLGKIGAGAKGIKALGLIASQGAVNRMGLQEEDKLENSLSDILHGSVEGAVGFALGAGTGKAMSMAASKARDATQVASEKAMGIYNDALRGAFRKRLKEKRIDPEDFYNRVKALRDPEGKPIMSLASTPTEILEKLETTTKYTGKAMEEFLQGVKTLDGKDIELSTDILGESLISNIRNRFANDPSLVNMTARAEKMVKVIGIKTEQSKKMSLFDLQHWKNSLNKDLKMSPEINSHTDVERGLLGAITDAIEEGIDAHGGDPGMKAAFKGIKKTYETSVTARDFVEKSITAEENKLPGKIWKSLIYRSVGGAAVGSVMGMNPLEGAAIGASLKLAGKSPTVNRGLAASYKQVGKFLEATSNPEVVNRITSAAQRSFADYENQIQRESNTLNGILNDAQEQEAWRQQVRHSDLSVREKLQSEEMIDNMRAPNIQARQNPFLKTYKAQERDASGKKVQDE